VGECHANQPASTNGACAGTDENEGEGPDQLCDQLLAHDLFSVKWLGL
jgi:hypothetical protein